MSPPASKRVTVLLRRPPDHPRTAQALRAALGYTTVGLHVRIGLLGPAQALLHSPPDQLSPAVRRALSTLSALGCPIDALGDCPKLQAACAESHTVVTW